MPDATASAGGTPRRRLKITLIVLGVLVLAGLVTVFVVGARRYQQLVGLGKQAREQYGVLNQSIPFTPPAPGQEPSGERWTAMLRVRERMLARLTPELERTLNQPLGADPAKTSSMGVVWSLMPAVSALQRVMEGHVEALRAEQMSPREYQWLLGLAMREAMANPERYAAGAAYWQILRQLERLTAASQGGRKLDADQAYKQLAKAYDGYRLDETDVLEKLQHPGQAAYAADWLAVAAQWIPPMEMKPKSLLR